VDEASVQILTHPGAIYLHEGETYRVAKLDFETHSVEVQKAEVDYFTRPMIQSSLNVKSVRESLRLPNGWSRIGEVETSWSVIAFRKIKFYTQDNLGIEPLSLPTQLMQTVALWLRFEQDNAEQDPSARSAWVRGLQGLQNVLSSALPMLVLCDRSDIGSVIQLDQGEVPAIYLFDRYPGGMGFAERGFSQMRELLALAHDIVFSCGCDTGCPSCVGVLETAFPGGAEWTQSLPDKAVTLRILKAATR
jgi:DEAD/DEAH box helicase domain-containing protein